MLAEAAARLLEGPGDVGVVVCVDVDEIICSDPFRSRCAITLRDFLTNFAAGRSERGGRESGKATRRSVIHI